MRANLGDGDEGVASSVMSVSPYCINILIVSINISVQNHIVTRTMSLARFLLPNPAPFLVQFPSTQCHDPK